MIEIAIPGYKTLQLKHLVTDYNGTVACDGKLISGVNTCLKILAENLQIHIITADTFGTVQAQLKGVPCHVSVLPPGDQDVGKLAYVKQLGCEHTVSVGNGRNDYLMLKESVLGIGVILTEGAATKTLMSADVVTTDIISALELLINPLRLTATLRS